MSKKLKALLAVVSLLGIIGTVWVSIHYHSNNVPSISSGTKEPSVSSADVLFRRDISSMTIEVGGIPEELQSKLGIDVNAIPKFNVPKRKQESLIQELQLGRWINRNFAGGSGWGDMVTIEIQYENSDQVCIVLGFVPYDGGTIYSFGVGRSTDSRYDAVLNESPIPEFRGRSMVEFMKLVLDAWLTSTNPGEPGA